jgi:hypothetical protein
LPPETGAPERDSALIEVPEPCEFGGDLAADALEWLDYSDAVAIDIAERRLAAGPYIAVTLPYSVH